MELTENDQLKRTINKLSNEIGATKVHAAASASLAEMLNEKLEEVQRELEELRNKTTSDKE